MSSKFLRKALSNSFWTSLSAIVNAVLSLLVAGLTIRWLGLEEAGFVLFLQAIVGANKSVFSLGMHGGCLRYVSEAHAAGRQEQERRLLDTVLAFNIGSTALLVLGLALLIPWFIEISHYGGDRIAAETYGHLILMALLIGAVSSTCRSALEAAQEFRFVALAGTGFRLLNNGAKVAFLSVSPSLFTLGLIDLSLAVLSLGIFLRKFYQEYHYVPRLRAGWSVFLTLWRFSRWSYLMSLGNTVLGNFDRILVGAFFSASVLPFYSMAKRGYLIGHEVMAGLASFFFPMLASAGEEKHAIIERIEPRVRWLLSGIGILFYGGMILVGPTLLNVIVQPGFGTRIAPLIMIFGCVGMISLQTIMPYHVAMATDRPWMSTSAQYLNTGLTFLVMLAFAWRGSLTGVVAAHLCDFFAVMLYYFLMRPKSRHPSALAHEILSPVLTVLVAWMVMLATWSVLYLQDASWYVWTFGGGAMVPVAVLLALFLERRRGDPYRSLETVRSIHAVLGERFTVLRVLRIPFVSAPQSCGADGTAYAGETPGRAGTTSSPHG